MLRDRDLGSVSTGYSDRPVARAIKIKHAGLNLTGQERNNEQTKNFNKSLALAASSGPKLQAASGKLQATSCKLDKTPE